MQQLSWSVRGGLVAAAFACLALAGACLGGSSPEKPSATSGVGGDDGFGGFSAGGGDPDLPSPDPCASSGDCTDFPAEPIYEEGAPTNAGDLFGEPDPSKFAGTPPCALEPQLSDGSNPGAMLPANWTTPRFRFSAVGDLFEIRVASPVQSNDLVVYTTTPQWTMAPAMWMAAAENNAGQSMTITIRALTTASPETHSGVQGDILIAPVNAGGSMVFWTVKDSNVGPDSSKLYGFSVGDLAVTEVLAPKTVAFDGVLHEGGEHLRGQYGGGKPGFDPGEVQCIGCHTSTPDGAAVVFTDDWPWNKAIASVEEDSQGQVPSYLSAGARALLKMPWLGTQSMSPAYFVEGQRLLLASYAARSVPFSTSGGQNDRLIWIDLQTSAAISDAVDAANPQQAKQDRDAAIIAAEGSAWGQLTMTGETASAVTPSWSHDGDSIVYVSTDDSPNGHPSYDATRADLYIVPFADKQGGSVQAVDGAADPGFYEYYPAFSADDELIAFNQAPAKNSSNCPGSSCPDGPYYNRYGQIHVIPTAGGTPTRLLANDPVACAGDDMSAGLINSWPKWSPNAVSIDGKTYYFLIFSSARSYPGSFTIPAGPYTPQTLDTRSSQLYMAAIVVDDASGDITSYPGVYLWNQNRLAVDDSVTDEQNSNLTPAWDDFLIPEVPEVPH